MAKKLPTPGAPKLTDQQRIDLFQEMYEKFTAEATKKTGYAMVPQIGPNGPFNTLMKVSENE